MADETDGKNLDDDLLHDGLRLVKKGRIGGIALHAMAEGRNLVYRFLRRLVDDQVGEGDIGPFLGKFERDGLANPAGRSGNEGHFSV